MTTETDKFKVDYLPHDKGAFVISENGDRIAELVVGLADNVMSVYHTGVEEEHEDKGLGTALIDALADHARKNNLTLNIFCPFVKKMFTQNQDKYGDVYVHRPTFVKLD